MFFVFKDQIRQCPVIDLMRKFELCYDFEPGKSFLIPDLLPKDEPYTGEWDSALVFQYEYNILPSSIISRFIVRMSSFISNDTVWRSGVMLKNNGNMALVKADSEERKVYIWVKGDEVTRRDFLSTIRNKFEDIHQSLSALEADEKIFVPNRPDEPPIDYKLLLEREKKGSKTYISPLTGEEFSIKELLDVVEPESTRRNRVETYAKGHSKTEQEDIPDTLSGTDVSIKIGESIQQKRTIVEENRPIRITNDQVGGPDKLKYSRYAKAFADLVNNKDLSTPITIGIYGPWGAGKSFLMREIKKAIKPQEKAKWYQIRKRFRQYQANRSSPINVHVIDFNAWVYSGSEHLWASLVTHLYKDIEEYCGLKSHTMRLWKAIKKSFPKAMGAFAFYSLLGLFLSILLDYNKIQVTWNAAKLAANAIGGSIIGGSALASLPVLFSAMREFFDSLFLSRANKLQNLASRPDFRTQIGIMADIKDEIKFIRKLLKKSRYGHPTRLVLFIDDLDRCEHQKAVEVLQAIMLLLADEDGSPFVIFLGIDARVVVHAIEEHYGDVLVKAGINGYEYLDKIIQVPFAIPTASRPDIDDYVDSLLYESEQEKVEIEKRFQITRESPGQLTPLPASSSYPELPTAALFGETNKVESSPVQTEEKPENIKVTFTQLERKAIKACSCDLTENPRKIKRIVNIYRLARLLLPSDQDRQKAIRWILLTEQWPLHAAWILETIENDDQKQGRLSKKTNATILDAYKNAKKSIHAKETETILGIDADPTLFEQFIKKAPIFTVQEIKNLLPYTFNLNPAIRSEVSKQALRLAGKKPKRKKKATAIKPASSRSSTEPAKA